MEVTIKFAPLSGMRIGGYFTLRCIRDGNVIWEDVAPNLWVNEGLDEALDILLGSTAKPTVYVGLSSTATPASGWTMANQGSTWNEFTSYSESVRQTYSAGSASGQSIDNSASKATFSINGSGTVEGLFLTTDNTKGGTSGALLCAADLSGGSRSVQSGDSLEATYTCTSADDGV